jgi:tetratricopeptide (TPR) repeat protein
MVAWATEQGFTRWVLQGAVLQGWLLVQQGEGQEGILEMRRGHGGSTREQSYEAALLAEAYGREGQTEEGLKVVTEELAWVKRMSRHFYEAELFRIKGHLVLSQEKTNQKSIRGSEAETCFRQAIEIARKQGAKSLELRGVMSLSRLLHQQGKTDEAREMLAEIYGWFTPRRMILKFLCQQLETASLNGTASSIWNGTDPEWSGPTQTCFA